MRSRAHGLAAVTLLAALVAAAGCATVPGNTGQEQTEAIDSLVIRTLADLERQHPESKAEIAASAGYVIMNNKLTKIPLVGIGAGYGVGIETTTGTRTYLRMRRFDLGLGIGARAVRPVIVFQDAEKFRRYIDGNFDAKIGAEATAKAGEKGAAGGGGTKGEGYTSYLITDTGVSATASLAVMRVKRIKLKDGATTP
jgi:hypothetical protein